MISTPLSTQVFAPSEYAASIMNVGINAEPQDSDMLNLKDITIEGLEEYRDWLASGEDTPPTEVSRGDDPDIKRTIQEIVQAYGCLFEEHTVVTSDGYHLKMFRINYQSVSADKKPVLVQHGLFADADTWCIHRDASMAFKLAKAGYDVWLGNNRGNKYSNVADHSSPQKNPRVFYDYSFYELGKYDAPAQVDFVRKFTNNDKISYIGHSQGTSQMFSALSSHHGGLSDKLNVFVACAPVITMANSPNGLFNSMASLWKSIDGVIDFFGFEAISSNPWGEPRLKTFCRLFGVVCDGIVSFTSETSQWNAEQASAVAAGRGGSRASMKQTIHYAQIFKYDLFQQYNYGSDRKNKAHYGGTSIPLIDLTQIEKVPIAFYVGGQDDLADPKDAKYNYDRIDTAEEYHEYPDMDHYSFQTGKNMSYVDDVLKTLAKYNGAHELEFESVEETLF